MEFNIEKRAMKTSNYRPRIQPRGLIKERNDEFPMTSPRFSKPPPKRDTSRGLQLCCDTHVDLKITSSPGNKSKSVNFLINKQIKIYFFLLADG